MGKSALYINGNEVSRHFCGYTPFITDITDNVNYGEENEIAITLDNSDDPLIPPGKPQDGLDFSYDGGLYRSVTLTLFLQTRLAAAEFLFGIQTFPKAVPPFI